MRLLLLFRFHVDKHDYHGDGEEDEEDGDGADEEIFEEPGFVLGNTIIEFVQVLPKRCIAIDGAHGESLPIERGVGRGIHEEHGFVFFRNGEEAEILRGVAP